MSYNLPAEESDPLKRKRQLQNDLEESSNSSDDIDVNDILNDEDEEDDGSSQNEESEDSDSSNDKGGKKQNTKQNAAANSSESDSDQEEQKNANFDISRNRSGIVTDNKQVFNQSITDTDRLAVPQSRRVAIKTPKGAQNGRFGNGLIPQEEEKDLDGEEGIIFEEVLSDQEQNQDSQNNQDSLVSGNKLTAEQAHERKSFRDKLRSGTGMKGLMASALTSGIKAVQNIKEGVVTGLHESGNFLFTGQEKKAAQKRLSEDFTVSQTQDIQQISAQKTDQIRSEHRGDDSKRDSEDENVDSEERKRRLEEKINKQLNFNSHTEEEDNKSSSSSSSSSSSDRKKQQKRKSKTQALGVTEVTQRQKDQVADKSSDEDNQEMNEDDILNESDDDDDVLGDDDDGDDDNSELSEGEKKKLLANLDKDDDDDDDDSDSGDSNNSHSMGELSNVREDDANSLITNEIENRSIEADEEEPIEVIDKENYLRYVSEKFSMQTDVLEVVDKNERSFKQVAERLIQQTSYLTQPLTEVGISLQSKNSLDDTSSLLNSQSQSLNISRRLILPKHLGQISNRYHADLKASQGLPYCLAASEQYLAVGSSDGSVRIFDNSERELKTLLDKSVKGTAVMCMDMQRSKGNNIFIVTGHSKGQITLHEVKGLKPYQEVQPNQVTSKHLKTITDVHSVSVVQIKFVGELGTGIQSLTTVSCDLDGVVYITLFQEGIMSYQCKKQCFMRKKVGPTFSISPLLQYSTQTIDEIIQEQLQYQIQNGGSSTEIDFSRKKPQIVAFGALERIIIAQIRPSPKEILNIDRPDYIVMGTVPYIDWGLALTPSFRDKSYPVLAIAWGKVLQLGIYINFDQPVGAVQEQPIIMYDGYYVCEHTIDACYFLSESIIFVIVNKQEVRILYTQNFTPGLFDETYQLNDPNRTKSASELLDPVKRQQYFNTLKERFAANIGSQYAEKDKGYRLLQEGIRFRDQTSTSTQQKSKFNSNPSMCKNFDNMVFALGKTSIGQGRLLHWEEYLNIIRKTYPDDWLKDLKASLDIFNGKLIGLAGLPDQKETREHMLRERMKELMRKNIDACIKEFQEGECVSSKTLRVAVEFCIRVNAIDHLFGELFQMFAEAGMEQRFFENLEPFILSGKFKNCKIPEQILIRLIGYQRQKDLELLEKTLLNVDLNKYACLLEVRHICETEMLTSALIHILLNEFDDDRESTVCLQLLCSLYNMKKKSKNQSLLKSEIFKLLSYDPLEKDNRFKLLGQEEESKAQSSDRSSASTSNSVNTSITGQQISALSSQVLSSGTNTVSKVQKLEIEQSSTYIGYKLMWVMKLFLEGKKFPQGTLTSFKWRVYVYDIVRFVTNTEFLSWCLEFDPDTFFRLMKSLFTEQEPYEYISSQKAFIEMYKDQINGLDECMTHSQLIETLHKAIQTFIDSEKSKNQGKVSSKGECALNSFINFLAQISKKQQVIIPPMLCLFAAKESIKFSQKLLKIPNLMSEEVHKSFQTQLQKQSTLSKPDKMSQIYNVLIKKIEKDVMTLISRCELDLDDVDIKLLLKEAERSPMYKVRVQLQQLLGNYDECLTLHFKIPAIRNEVFSWLQQVQQTVKVSSRKLSQSSGYDDSDRQFGQQEIQVQLKNMIMNNIAKFVEMDSESTIKLAEIWLDRDHQFIINRLGSNDDLIFKYLEILFKIKESEIEAEYNQLMITGFRSQSRQYAEFQKLIQRFVEVLCNKKNRLKLAEYVKKKYYPADECLKIIREAIFKDKKEAEVQNKKYKVKVKEDMNEALALLLKRKGDYKESVDLFTQVLVDLAIAKIVHALYLNERIPFNSNQTKDVHILRYDALLIQVLNICEKYGSRLPDKDQEQLWLHSIKNVYNIQKLVTQKSGNSLNSKYLEKFATFQNIRIQEFMTRMSQNLKLDRILEFLEEVGHPIKYQEFRKTFEDKVITELHHENILANAKTLIVKDLMNDTINLKNLHSRGASNKKEKCDYCKRDIMYKWDIQSVCMFLCGHIFHQRCVSTTDFKCMLCFNEFDQIQTIINKRGIRRTALKKNKDSGSVQDDESDRDDHFNKKRKNSKTYGKDGVSQLPSKNKKTDSNLQKSQQKNALFEIVSKQMYKFDMMLGEQIIDLKSF